MWKIFNKNCRKKKFIQIFLVGSIIQLPTRSEDRKKIKYNTEHSFSCVVSEEEKVREHKNWMEKALNLIVMTIERECKGNAEVRMGQQGTFWARTHTHSQQCIDMFYMFISLKILLANGIMYCIYTNL